MTEDLTIYDAIQAFDALTQAVAFSSNEHALVFALFRTWNAARRPAVIEQWADTTCRNAGLTRDTMPKARNKLVQKGVIFYDKEGNRSVPRYSLNALFELEDPFLLREIRSKPPSNPRSKRRVSDGVNGDSYQEKEKRKESTPQPPEGEWEGIFPKGSLQKSQTEQKRIRVLRSNSKMEYVGSWFGRKPDTLWSVAEAKALRDLSPPREEVELMARYRATPSDIHRRDVLTLLNNWSTELDRARSTSGPTTKKPDPFCGVAPL